MPCWRPARDLQPGDIIRLWGTEATLLAPAQPHPDHPRGLVLTVAIPGCARTTVTVEDGEVLLLRPAPGGAPIPHVWRISWTVTERHEHTITRRRIWDALDDAARARYGPSLDRLDPRDLPEHVWEELLTGEESEHTYQATTGRAFDPPTIAPPGEAALHDDEDTEPVGESAPGEATAPPPGPSPTPGPVPVSPSALAFSPGRRYRLRYRSDTQRRDRTAVMDYLAEDREHLVFSARPVAGTQRIPRSWLRAVEQVPADTPVHLNRLTH